MLQSQSNIFITMAREMVVNNVDQRALIKANMEVSKLKKRQMRFNNFKAVRDLMSHVGKQRDFQGPQNQNQSWKKMPILILNT